MKQKTTRARSGVRKLITIAFRIPARVARTGRIGREPRNSIVSEAIGEKGPVAELLMKGQQGKNAEALKESE